MAISKKQAKQIANLINSCTCWAIAFKDEIASPNFDPARAKRLRGYHDQYAQELNDLLGVEAVIKYEREVA